MTGEQHSPAGGFPTAPWLFLGIFIVAFYGIVGYASQDRASAGALMAGVAALLVIGAFALWQRARSVRPVPAAEYLAVVWLLSYVTLAAIDTLAEGSLPALDWLFLMPPLSVIPIGLRVLLGDDGSPDAPARTAAYYAHQVIGILLCGLGLVLVVSVWLIVAAPLPLVPGVMHLRAGFLYRQERSPRPAPDPRRGFMD